MHDQTLHISTSPHLKKSVDTAQIMRHVVYAMLPLVVFAVYNFGINAGLVIGVAVLSCVGTEHFLNKRIKGESTINDWSAVVTGILFGLILPPIFPLWMTAVGGILAISTGKIIFGGLGYNVFNPALVGRAILQGAFPVAITTWYAPMLEDRFTKIDGSVLTFPFMTPSPDAMTGATPLSAWKFDGVVLNSDQIIMGGISGSAGETSAILIALGGLYLIARGFMNWRIPFAILLTVFAFSGILNFIDPSQYPPPIFMLFSGGLMLGAVFMATDMVASPLTSTGVFIYGVFIGILVVVIRIWGGLPEGVMYAILLGNAASPHIERLIRYRVYGTSIRTT